MKKLIVLTLVFFLFAGCSSTEYKVKFNSNGGTLIEEQLIANGKKLTKPVDPTKEGYKFIGWELAEEEFNFNEKITKDLVLDAKWEVLNLKTYKVTYDLDGSVSEKTVNSGDSAPEPEKPIKNGYIFLGWYIKDETDPYNFDIILNDNIALIAKFEKIDTESSSEFTEQTIFVTEFEANVETNEIKVGETLQITTSITPDNASNKTVKFSSDKTRIATVSQTGLIRALRTGEVTIKVETTDTSDISQTIKITVIPK